MPCFGKVPKINLNLEIKLDRNKFSLQNLKKSVEKKISFLSMGTTEISEYNRHRRCIEKLENEQYRRQKQLNDLKRAATCSRPSSDDINSGCRVVETTRDTCDEPSCPVLLPPYPCAEQPVCTLYPGTKPVCTPSPCKEQPMCTPYSCTDPPACPPYPCKEKPVCTLYPCTEQPVCSPYICREQPACTPYSCKEHPACTPYSCKEHPACTLYPRWDQPAYSPHSCTERPACPANPCTEQPKCAPRPCMDQSTCTLPSCPSRTTSTCKALKKSIFFLKVKKRKSLSCRVTPSRQSISPNCGFPCKEQVCAPCTYVDRSTCTLPSCPTQTPSPCDSRASTCKASKKKRKSKVKPSLSYQSICSDCGGPMCTGREDCCCKDCIKYKPVPKCRKPPKRSCSKDKQRRCCKCRRKKRRKLKRWRRRRCRQPRNLCFRCFICCILFGTVVACVLTFIPIFAGTQ